MPAKKASTRTRTAARTRTQTRTAIAPTDPRIDRNIITEPANSGEPQDVDLIKETLRGIMRDNDAPAAARAQAARTLAELAGVLGRHAKPPAPAGKPIAEMSRAEIEAELTAMQAA